MCNKTNITHTVFKVIYVFAFAFIGVYIFENIFPEIMFNNFNNVKGMASALFTFFVGSAAFSRTFVNIFNKPKLTCIIAISSIAYIVILLLFHNLFIKEQFIQSLLDTLTNLNVYANAIILFFSLKNSNNTYTNTKCKIKINKQIKEIPNEKTNSNIVNININF